MTRLEHLLTIAGEECAESAQRFSKAIRFGLDEVQPGQRLSNRERIMGEFHDLVATMELVGLNPRSLDDELIRAKKAKVETFLGYSAECGTLADPPSGQTWKPRTTASDVLIDESLADPPSGTETL